ncbi:hypothetical protein FB99_43270 (plasmid) [Pantoea agglomerans]|nr:hypothetical protein FB99_43270 [Pantoea agglomerans]
MLPVSRLNWPDMSKAGRSDTVYRCALLVQGRRIIFQQ